MSKVLAVKGLFPEGFVIPDPEPVPEPAIYEVLDYYFPSTECNKEPKSLMEIPPNNEENDPSTGLILNDVITKSTTATSTEVEAED